MFERSILQKQRGIKAKRTKNKWVDVNYLSEDKSKGKEKQDRLKASFHYVPIESTRVGCGESFRQARRTLTE